MEDLHQAVGLAGALFLGTLAIFTLWVGFNLLNAPSSPRFGDTGPVLIIFNLWALVSAIAFWVVVARLPRLSFLPRFVLASLALRCMLGRLLAGYEAIFFINVAQSDAFAIV